MFAFHMNQFEVDGIGIVRFDEEFFVHCIKNKKKKNPNESRTKAQQKLLERY